MLAAARVALGVDFGGPAQPSGSQQQKAQNIKYYVRVGEYE
jgi:hypothetical protein